MKEITKEIRQAVKEMIQNVGGTQNLLNKHVLEIEKPFLDRVKYRSKEFYEILTTIDNQIDYFRISKGM